MDWLVKSKMLHGYNRQLPKSCMQNKQRKKGVNNKSTTSCLCAETTLILRAPAVTVETDMHISNPTP